jgi:Kef-type K+ transport system membrane component KefB
MAMLGRFAGIDLRRPASWIACASGLFVGWWFAVWTTADDSIVGSMAMLLTAVAVVAAIGEPPADLCRPTGRSSFGAWLLVWTAERAAWPLIGVALGMAVAGGYPAATGSLVMATLGALLAVVTMVVSRLSGAKAADAASLTLVMAAASAAAASRGRRPSPTP